jgi:hypothetical protein
MSDEGNKLHPATALDITESSGRRPWWKPRVPHTHEHRELADAWRSEADHLTRLILLRIVDREGSPESWKNISINDVRERVPPWQQEFVFHRFSSRIRWYAHRYPQLIRWHTVLALLVLAAGLGTSGITALNETRDESSTVWTVTVIVLGVLVGIFTGLSQIWKPGQKSSSYYVGQNDLRQEGWDFVQRRGRYKDKDYPDEAFELFVEAISLIERRALAVDLQGTGQPA